MLSQIIYTRCSNGRDLFNDGQIKIGSGFKVFSLSRELLMSGYADIDFIEDTVKKELPYNKRDAIKKEASDVRTENEFTDDAFLYFVPDFGMPFIMDFSVRIYVQGISDRPGNFINHAFAGKLTDTEGRLCYPCNFFHSKSFDAKLSEEYVYYQYKGSEVPDYLNCRKGLIPNPAFSFERVGEFIKQNNKEETLKKAVWFILKQLEIPAEKRKYLVIKGLESEIEMWIAAISYAFSPDIAQMIPFATRFNRPTVENKYNITPENKFSKNMSASIRYRAMILGVDVRDSVGMRDLRPMTNSTYVLLEDIQANIGELINPYFKLITQYDEKHRWFTHDFLRCDGKKITFDDIVESFHIFNELCSDVIKIRINHLVEILKYIKRYEITNIPNWENIKRVALDCLGTSPYGFDAVSLAVDIDKNRGFTDYAFMDYLCDCLINNIIIIAGDGSKNDIYCHDSEYSMKNFSPSTVNDRKTLTDYWNLANDVFKDTEFYFTLCCGIAELAPDKIGYSISTVQSPYKVNNIIKPFLNIYIFCISVCRNKLDVKKVLNFVAELLHMLLSCNYKETVIEILKDIREKNSQDISFLRTARPFQSMLLSDFMRRNFGCEIIPVKTVDDLILVCRGKNIGETDESNLEYFLADYYKEKRFSAEILINKVLTALVINPSEQNAVKHPLPYPYGLYFFDKCIEQHIEDFEYVQLIREITSPHIMLSMETREILLYSIDDNLASFIPDSHYDAKKYAPGTPQLQTADRMDKLSVKRLNNSRLIKLFSLLINRQVMLKVLTKFARDPIPLPNASYGDAVISAVSKLDFTADMHLALLAIFCDYNTNAVTAEFVYKYLDSILDGAKVNLFIELNRPLLCGLTKNESAEIKFYEDIYGKDYSTSEGFAVMRNTLRQSIKILYKNRFESDIKFLSSLSKMIGKNEEMLKYFEDEYGFNDSVKLTKSRKRK